MGSAPNVVIASVCMNRNGFLRKSAEEWRRFGLPMVIVDWSSAPPVRETLADVMEGVTIVEAPGKRFFHLAKSKNLSCRACRLLHPEAEYVLSFDCDVYAADPGAFFEKYPPRPDVFYVGGSGRPAAAAPGKPGRMRISLDERDEHRNRWATFGTFLAALPLLEEVNMNDERMEGYGGFDVDLYDRMEGAGASRRKFDFADLVHQPHAERTGNFREKKLSKSLSENLKLMDKMPRWDRTFEQERQRCIIDGREWVL